MIQNTLTLSIEKLKAEGEQTFLKLTSLRRELMAQADSDFEGVASDLLEHEMVLGRIQDLESRLASIEHALQKVKQGTYGVCEWCGQPIDPARLEVVPETTLCIGCKTVGEQPAKMKTHLSESEWSEEWRVRKLTDENNL
jgi:DnaK suppressor protein